MTPDRLAVIRTDPDGPAAVACLEAALERASRLLAPGPGRDTGEGVLGDVQLDGLEEDVVPRSGGRGVGRSSS